MKTALRTYHPVPSLQKTNGNLQDAPRIKNCLKAAVLPSDLEGLPSSLADVLAKRVGSPRTHCEPQRPPTSIVNLIFIMANQTTVSPSKSKTSLFSLIDVELQLLGRNHFDSSVEFIDLFMPVNIPSSARARAFLWLVYHHLQDPDADTNPFADDHSRANPGKVPWLPRLSTEEMRTLRENSDPADEIEWGNRMCAQRTGFLQKLVSHADAEKKNKSVFKPPQSA